MLIDTLGMQFRTVNIRRDPDCPMCGTRTITELIDYDVFCGSAPSADVRDGRRSPSARRARCASGCVRGDDFDLLDVREPCRVGCGHVEGARLVPLGTLASVLPQLDRDRDIVVMCQSGGRSARAARQLRDAGFARITNMTGGMARWQRDVTAE